MVYVQQLVTFIRGLLSELDSNGGGGGGGDPEPRPDPGPISRVRLRILRAQYNRKLHPEQYTPDNPDGLYRGKHLEAIRNGSGALNRESNLWADLTAYGPDGVELQRDQIRRLGLGYRTAFYIGDGLIVGGGQDDEGRPLPWDKSNPTGANISEEAWRTSLGYTVRIHFSDEGEYTVSGAVAGHEGEPFTVRVS
jgi:hypothetical protein